MTENERLDEWFNTHDGEDYCSYCSYSDECPHGMTCYGGEPIEPPCASGNLRELLDLDAILDSINSEEALRLEEELTERIKRGEVE